MSGYITHRDSDPEYAGDNSQYIDITYNNCVGIAIQIREVFISDNSNNPIRVEDFDGYYIHLKDSDGTEEDDEDLSKAEDFNLLYNGTSTGEVESFLFFSDPHYFQSYDTSDSIPSAAKNINNMFSHYKYTATNFVLCGGDWLTNHKKSAAVKALGKIDGWMNKTFDKFYPVYGNHDNNYQGELDTTTDTNANDGSLTNQQMINLWFRPYKKMYYSFTGTSTKFYVFDTGIDWNVDMNDYRWEQVDWFANQLLSNNDSNIIIVMHIVSNNG